MQHQQEYNSLASQLTFTAALSKLNFSTLWVKIALLTHKVHQTDVVFVCHQGLLVSLYMQDYKTQCATAAICATLIIVQTHR